MTGRGGAPARPAPAERICAFGARRPAEGWARLTLEPRPEERGAAPCGVVAPLALAIGRAAAFAERAERYPALRLALTAEWAVFWAPQPGPLPWFETAVFYLGAPRRRIFAPVGWRVATPELLLAPLLAAIERAHGLVPPLLAAPPLETLDPSPPGHGAPAPLRLIDLSASLPLEQVDWRALAAAPSRSGAG